MSLLLPIRACVNAVIGTGNSPHVVSQVDVFVRIRPRIDQEKVKDEICVKVSEPHRRTHTIAYHHTPPF